MYLRKLADKDIPFMLEWMHDSEVNCWFRFPAAMATEGSAAEFIAASAMDIASRHYAICNDEDEYMGTISLKNISSIDRNAEFAIALRKRAWGKGYASWGIKEILKIAFEELDLVKVYMNVLADNLRAIRLYKKMGFQYEGEFQRHWNIHGKWKNIQWYAIFKEE